MPRLKKKEVATPPVVAAPEPALTLTAGRSRRTIKPNRKYLNDSVVSMPPSKTSSRSSSPDSDLSEDEYRKNPRDEEEEDDDDDEEIAPVKSTGGRKSTGAAAAAAKKTSSISPGSRPRGRPPKSGKAAVKTEPVKNFRKEVLKKMDLTTLSVGKARVVLTPLKQDPKRKLMLDDSVEKVEKPATRTTRESEKEKEKEKEKGKVVAKQREPEKVPPAAIARERAKSEVRVVKKKAEPPPKTETAKEAAAKKDEADKKVINPVAVKKQLVEKSILDKRAKKVEEEKGGTEEEEEDDDDDEVQIVGISRETNPVLGRKTARKSPLVAKQISPLPRKVPGKATPPVGAGLKRKAVAEPEPKPVRPTKNAKLSITIDSDVTESDDDVEEVEDEPVRRKTRSSLPTEKDSAASTPQNSSGTKAAAKDSPASTRGKKETESSSKATLSKSISMPALDKTKQGLPGKSVQTPAAKSLGLSKPMAASTPKPSAAALPSKSKSELNLVDPIHSPEKGSTSAEKAKAKNATIRIVDIGDIIKKRAASTPDIRKDAYASSSSDSSDDEQSADKPKTNTELVASILERKQAVNVDHLRTNRPPKRGRPAGSTNKASPKARQSKPATAEEDEIDFEDMLQTNIVTANKVQKVMQPAARHRRSDENTNKPTQNNNTLYKSNNNGRFGSNTSLNRSGSASPHKNPPRILNSTMKMGDNRPFAKLVSNSGNKHYSIDLTDPDNNVKLVEASSDSPPPTATPAKRGPPVKTITRPVTTSTSATGLRNASNAINKPVGGAVQRSVSALTAGSAAAGSSPKMKKITCYETWYVINIPNSENKPEKPTFAMSMIGLGNEADKIQLPSAEWSHKIILTKRKTPPSEGDEVFNGDVEDRAINEEEKRNYEPCNIMFRRRTATPGKFNLQYDRAVIFKNDTFFINVDGKNCQLVGAPTTLDDTADIETLLSVVDFVNLKNTCVELSAA